MDLLGVLNRWWLERIPEVRRLITDHVHTTMPGGTMDHGGLGGLLHNDHPQYALLAGAPTIWNPLAPPLTANAQDDEMNDSAVAAAWTKWDIPGRLTVTEDERGHVHAVAALAAWELTGEYKAVPSASDFTIWTYVDLIGLHDQDCLSGLGLWEDPTDPTKAIDVFYLFKDLLGGIYVKEDSWTDYNTVAANHAALAHYLSGVFLRIRYTHSTTTFVFDASDDGVNFEQVYSEALMGFAPTAYGLVSAQANASAVSRSLFPFFRKLDSDVGAGGIMYGDRVKLWRN